MGLTRARLAQVETVTASLQDPITLINRGADTANVDVGFVLNRDGGTSSNIAVIWDETNDILTTVYTDSTGGLNSNINITGYTNFKADKFYGNIGGGTAQANVFITGSLIPSANVTYDLGTSSKRFKDLWLSGSTINIGSETLSVSSEGTWSFSSAGHTVSLGFNTSFNSPTITTETLAVTGNLTVSGNTFFTTQSQLVVNDSLINLHTNANLDPLLSDDGKDIGVAFHYYKTNPGIAFLGWDNSTGYLEYYAAGTETANVYTGTDYGTVKAGELLIANSTASTSSTTGALQVAGGVGVAGAVNVGSTIKAGGNIVASSGTASLNHTTGAIVIAGTGGLGVGGAMHVQGASSFLGNIIAGNIQLSGNINVPVGGTFSNTGTFFGNAGGIGALYAGTTSYTPLDHTVLQLTGNIDNYVQVNFQNVNSGNFASADYVATADNGTDDEGYINLGINSSTFNDPDYPGFYPNDGYLIHHGVGTAGNLIVLSELADTAIKFRVGSYSTDITAITTTGLHVNVATTSTSTSTGALKIAGGAGIAGNVFAGGFVGQQYGTLYIGTTDVNYNRASASQLLTGVGIDGTATTATTSIQTKFTANTDAGTAYVAFAPITTGNAALNASTSLTFNPSTGLLTPYTLSTTTGTVATLNSTLANITGAYIGTLVTTNLSTGNAVISGGYISALTNATITTASVTTLDAVTATPVTLNATSANVTTLISTNFRSANAVVTGGSIDSTPVGATTATTGRFTTVVATGVVTSAGNLVANAGTDSTSVTTGAVVVVGGAGVSGNLVAAQIRTAGNINFTYANTVTAVRQVYNAVTNSLDTVFG